MMYVFTNKESPLKNILPRNTQYFTLNELSKHSAADTDIFYVDVTNLSDTDIKKTLTLIKKISKVCDTASWGIIDPKGSIKDIAAMFFNGASDYLGTAFFKDTKSIDNKRFKEALQWRKTSLGDTGNEEAKDNNKLNNVPENTGVMKTGVKFPSANAFPGWKKLQIGKTMPFYILFCSLKGKTSFDACFEDKTITQIHKRFLSYLNNVFSDAEGLLWMDSGRDCLFLLPPKAKSAEAVVESCVRMIISAPLVSIEALGISIPVNFVFALHYDTINYMPPGETGNVISDAVNFIFHLGHKKAESGRLTVSNNVPDNTIQKSLEDCFVSAGEYEGRKIWHTKKFDYAKPWI